MTRAAHSRPATQCVWPTASPALRAIARSAGGWLLALACTLATGCSRDIENYGEQDISVNGTSVFAGMFTRSGRQVFTRNALSPRVGRATTIVWFARSIEPPAEDAIAWLDRWMSNQGERTLIYVRRDYDAAPMYWQTEQSQAPQAAEFEYKLREQAARARDSMTRIKAPERVECDWFAVEKGTAREVKSFDGPLAHGLDAAKTGIELRDRLTPVEDFEPLLVSGEDAIVSQVALGDSSAIFVANGSFLLNLPLVRHENRRLAGRLIDLTALEGEVAFLECNGSPEVLDADPEPRLPHTLAILGVWPLNVVLLHFAVVGILFCFARWPIAGRPQELPPPEVGAFGDHARALGKLFQRARAVEFAERRLTEYRNPKA